MYFRNQFEGAFFNNRNQLERKEKKKSEIGIKGKYREKEIKGEQSGRK